MILKTGIFVATFYIRCENSMLTLFFSNYLPKLLYLHSLARSVLSHFNLCSTIILYSVSWRRTFFRKVAEISREIIGDTLIQTSDMEIKID